MVLAIPSWLLVVFSVAPMAIAIPTYQISFSITEILAVPVIFVLAVLAFTHINPMPFAMLTVATTVLYPLWMAIWALKKLMARSGLETAG